MAAKKDEPKSAVPATTPKHELSPNYSYGADAGAGYEGTTQDDFTTPFLGLLQATSPELNSVEGARPGMLINSATKELIDGKTGVVFVPVATQHLWVEWVPREKGGGIVARHVKSSQVVQDALAKGFGTQTLPNGNELTETFYMFGYTLNHEDDREPTGMPMVISFTSTKIRPYKTIMQTVYTHLNPDRKRPPLWAHRLRVTTVAEKNNKGSFHNFHLAPVNGNKVGPSLIPPTLEDGTPHPLIAYGRMLNEQIVSGQRKMADEGGGTPESTGGDAPEGKAPF